MDGAAICLHEQQLSEVHQGARTKQHGRERERVRERVKAAVASLIPRPGSKTKQLHSHVCLYTSV